MKKVSLAFTLVSILGLAISSCKKDHGDEHEHDHEAITKVELHFTKAGTTTPLVFSWTDADGDGGNPPVVQEIALEENATYSVAIELYDGDGHDLTHDIEDHEAAHHRFYYTPDAATGITINGLDKDENNVTLGLKSVWTTTGHGEGKVKITLRHYQNANKAEADLINSSKSSTDAELTFDVHVH